MNSAVLGIEFCAMHDAIEPGHGPPRMKTFAAVREMEMMCKVAQTASLSAPLVQIAHQDGGHAFLLPCVCADGQIGSASCWERGCQSVWIAVVACSLKQKTSRHKKNLLS